MYPIYVDKKHDVPMRSFFVVLLIIINVCSSAQEIAGTVLDEHKEPMISAGVQVFQGGVLKGGVITDYDGNYVVKPLAPGYYDVQMFYVGFDSFIVKGVLVTPGNRTTLNAKMYVAAKQVRNRNTVWPKPIEDNKSACGTKIMRKEIKDIFITCPNDVIGLTPQPYPIRQIQEITGIVHGKRNLPLTNAKITVFRDGQIIGQTTSLSGHYVVQLRDPGLYDILITRFHYDSLLAKGYVVSPGNFTTINAKLRRAGKKAKCITIEAKGVTSDKTKTGTPKMRE